MTSRRPARPWLAALLVGAITGCHLVLWQTLVENAHCPDNPWCGFGAGLLLMFVGGPVALVLAAIALRKAGSSAAVLGTGALVLALCVLPNAAQELEPAVEVPMAAWPFVFGAVAAGWMLLERRIVGATGS